MPHDRLEIRIGSKTLGNFIEYRAASDVLKPADAFSCELGKLTPEEGKDLSAGRTFEMFVNGVLEMTGVIDKVTRRHSVSDLSASVEGRDLGGILVDSCVTDWTTLHEMALVDMTKALLKKLPFVKGRKVLFGKGARGSVRIAQYEPGVTVFDALSDYAKRLGLLFWIEPDGTLVFDKLKATGQAAYEFLLYKDPAESKRNNIVSIDKTDDLSTRFSECTVVGQVQGDDAWDAGEQSVTGTAKDKTFPFYKPLVVSDSVEGTDVGRRAEHELKKRTAAGYGIRLVVKGHSQGGVNYRANRLARVVDDALGISGRFMVLGRDFTYSEKDGPMTEIRLGLPMEGYEVS